ncbi:MAG: penicillin-binding transpeptidase domain-containing protein [Candidatus Eisenbacteria bacterium]
MNPYRARWRLFLVCVAGFGAWVLLVAGLVNVQIVKHEQYRKRAEQQHERRVTIPCNRGRIYDRSGEVLARTLSSTTIIADPELIQELGTLRATSGALSEILGIRASEVRGKLERESRFGYIARKVEPEVGDRIAAAGLSGIYCIPEKERTRPFDSLAVQVVGVTDVDMRGLEGIEREFEPYLRGEDGWKILQAIPKIGPRSLPGFPYRPPVDGCDVKLTLDASLQMIVEQEIAAAVERTGAAWAMALAMEPSSGDVLAMATHLSAGERRRTGGSILMNRCVAAQYEPGSTYKLVTYSAAFEERAVSPYEIFDAGNGEMDFGCFRVREARTSRYDRLMAREGFEKSSNIVSAQIGYRLGGRGAGFYQRGAEKLYSYSRAFGFGARTGITLPGEVSGVLRRPSDWSARSLGTIAFGQEVAVTLLQLTAAYAAIANDGVLMEPRIVDSVLWPDGSVRERFPPRAVRRVVSTETAALMRDLMRGVVLRGTGKGSDLELWRTSGKTGTAEMIVEGGSYSDERFTPSFVGYAPASDPRIVVAVVLVDVSRVFYGGVVAGPVFREIIRKSACSDIDDVFLPTLRQEAVATWAHVGEPSRAPAAPPFAACLPETMPDCTGRFLREAKARLLGTEAPVRLRGTGTVASQDPPPGTVLHPGIACTLVGSEP